METASLLWPHLAKLKRMWTAYEKKKKKKTSNQKDFLFIFPTLPQEEVLKVNRQQLRLKAD